MKLTESHTNLTHPIWAALQYRARRDASFYEMVEEFVAFKDRYGLTSVSKAVKIEHPELAKLAHWINKTRGKFSVLARGGTVHGMTERKEQVLKDAGFELAVSRHDSWDRNFKALLKYKARRRDCNVDTKKSKLGIWLRYVCEFPPRRWGFFRCWPAPPSRARVELPEPSHQRTYHKRFVRGDVTTPLTRERVALLEGAGVVWERIRCPAVRKPRTRKQGLTHSRDVQV
jgi:hypothetical protein